jgi:folylpolyglutamate synthase/dihydrofolate synthase
MAKIQPGLERIADLLRNVNFQWKAIHVAGTNGKGSICHYASSLITGRNIKVGKFTSPHLVDRYASCHLICLFSTNCFRWDCISINGKPIDENTFRKVEKHFLQINACRQIGASPFEILTATAFTIFNDAKVKIGIVEVGMGGKLDSTNILNNQAVSVISKIARDHEGFLGNTLQDIAGHKAGILRPNVPYIINPSNEENVHNVIQDYALEIGAGPRLFPGSFHLQEKLYNISRWDRVTKTMAQFQKENIQMAVVAVMQTLESMDLNPKPSEFAKTLLANLKMHHRGRHELVQVPPVFKSPAERKHHILVDGAHNPDAAKALNDVVQDKMRYGQTPSRNRPPSGWPVTWVLAMTEGKDARQYLATLLRPGDNVVTTTFGPVDGMPWVKPMDPKELLQVAKSVEPQITGVHVPIAGPLRALCTAKYLSNQLAEWAPIVLTGSLYFVGDFYRELRPRSSKTWWKDTNKAIAADRELILKIQAEERNRAHTVLSSTDESLVSGAVGVSEPGMSEAEDQKILQDEIDALNLEVERLEVEEKRLAETRSIAFDAPVTPVTLPPTTQDEQELTAEQRFEIEERRFAETHSTPEQIAEQIARAEKAKLHSERQAVLLENSAKERKEKAEAKAEKKAKSLERKLKIKEAKDEQRMRLKNEPQDRELPRKQYSKQQAALGEPSTSSEWSLKQYQDGLRSAPPSSDADSEDAHTNRERNITNFSSLPSNNSEPQDALSGLENTFFNRSSPRKPSNLPPKASSSQPAAGGKEGVRIHMHYANVGLSTSKMKDFPLERRTRAWSNPGGRNNEHYKTPANTNVIRHLDLKSPDGQDGQDGQDADGTHGNKKEGGGE